MKKGNIKIISYLLCPFLLLLLPLVLGGCKVYKTLNICKPTVCIPNTYQQQEGEGTVEVCEWWKQFNSTELDCLVDKSLSQNLTLKQSWWKVAQACAQARIVGAARYPEIITTPEVFHFRSSGGASGFGIGTGGVAGTTSTSSAADPVTFYLLANALTYEIDLWKKIDSQAKAACYELRATREDLESTAWTLTGTVTDLWFTIQEQKTLLKVIDHQIEVSRTQLELIELRYSVSESSALDVYQQRLQLAQTMAEKPAVQSLLETSINQMNVLLGLPPEKIDYEMKEGLVELPPFPNIGTPADLLRNRPDLRAEQRRLMAADYEVAAAIADRFPRLELSISYDFEAMKIKDIFDEQVSRIIGRLFTPIFDGGRRRAEVVRQKAIVCELLNSYGQKFLDALLEVENALVQERQQLELLKLLKQELDIAQTNLEEAQWHYINGLNDYLTVIASIQSLQNLERRMVTEKKQLLVIRSKLYRAIGGQYLTYWCY